MSGQALTRITEMERDYNKKPTTVIEKLVEESVKGDGDALCGLCAVLAKSVLYRTTLLLSDQADAQEVSKSVLLRVCEDIQSIRDAEDFRSWLGGHVIYETRRYVAEHSKYGIILNLNDYREDSAEDRDDLLDQDHSEYDNVRKEMLEIVSQMPLRLREAVILHYFDGLKISEVATAMGITYQSASRYLEIALKNLKYEIEKHPSSDGLGVLGFFPVGSVLSEAFRFGAEAFTPESKEWESGAVETCRQFILAGNEAASSATYFDAASAMGITAGISEKTATKTGEKTAAKTAAETLTETSAEASAIKLSFGAIMTMLTVFFTVAAISICTF